MSTPVHRGPNFAMVGFCVGRCLISIFYIKIELRFGSIIHHTMSFQAGSFRTSPQDEAKLRAFRHTVQGALDRIHVPQPTDHDSMISDVRDNYSTTSHDEQYQKDIAFTMSMMAFDDTKSVSSDSTFSKDEIEVIVQQRVEEEVRRRIEEHRKAEETKNKDAQEVLQLHMKLDKKCKTIGINGGGPHQIHPYEEKLLEDISISGQFILYLSTGRTIQHDGNHQSSIEYIITNRNVYQVLDNMRVHQKAQRFSVLYTFTDPLNLQFTKMLESLDKTDCTFKSNYCILHSIHSSRQTPIALQQFESILRLIPGSYQNGDWCQLNGFFGAYFNKKTMDISPFAPHSSL